MRMQEICKISGFTKRNIHYYIKEGLLSPVSDVQNGYYDFSEEEVKRLSLIRLFRNAGLSISVIRSILNTPDSTGLYLNQHIKELHKENRESIVGCIISITAFCISSFVYLRGFLTMCFSIAAKAAGLSYSGSSHRVWPKSNIIIFGAFRI